MNKLYVLTAIAAFVSVGAINADDKTDEALARKVAGKMKMDNSEKRSCMNKDCECENCECATNRCEICTGELDDSDEEGSDSRCNCGKPKPKN